MTALEQAEIDLTVVVGAATLPLSRVMSLSRGEILSLGRDASGPIALVANGQEIAKAGVKLIGDRVAIEIAPPR